MGYRNVNVAIVLVSFMFAACASQPTPEPKRETARTAAAPEAATPVASCRRSGRTTMVRGDCDVDWNGQTVRVSGTVDITPGTSSLGPCLRLQTKDASPLTVSPYGKFSCGGIDPALKEKAIVAGQQEESIDPARLRELLDYWKGPVDATLLKNGELYIGDKAECYFDHWPGPLRHGLSVACR